MRGYEPPVFVGLAACCGWGQLWFGEGEKLVNEARGGSATCERARPTGGGCEIRGWEYSSLCVWPRAASEGPLALRGNVGCGGCQVGVQKGIVSRI